MNPFDLSINQIISLLAQTSKPYSDDENRYRSFFNSPIQSAAVLIPFLRPFGPHSPWHILYTKRTNNVAQHKGQVAFPGGGTESCDSSPEDTALREAWEEVGIQPGDVQILGSLSPIQTVTNYLVTPIVGLIPWPFPIKLELNEVSRIFFLPLSWLADRHNYEIRSRQVTFPNSPERKELQVVYYKSYDNEILWGVSAEITLRLVEKLGMKNSSGRLPIAAI